MANTTDQRGTRLKQIWQDTGFAAPRLVQEKAFELQVLAPVNNAGGGGGLDGGSSGDAGGTAAPANGGAASVNSTQQSGCSVVLRGVATSSPLSVWFLLGSVLARRLRRTA